MNRDMETVVEWLNKLPESEALEVKLSLLNLLLPFSFGNVEFTKFLTELRDAMLGS